MSAAPDLLIPSLSERLQHRPRRALGRPRRAAVLVPIVDDGGPLRLLLTRRTEDLPTHAGQVAFPGGLVEPGEEDPIRTALREAEEEIGLDPKSVTVVGALDPYLTATGFRVFPVLGRVQPPQAFRLNHDEVEEVFEVPLATLMTPHKMRQSSRVLGGRERHFYELEFEGHTIWGATAGIIVNLYQRMFG
jgi:8-oxo-dGTP pyrophosphatase MutT (NUDIX family)